MDSQKMISYQVVTEESEEIWRDIPGFGENYMASNLGRIKCKERVVEKIWRGGKPMKQLYKERVLRGSIDRLGYVRHHIGFDSKKITVLEHTLVLLAFVGPRPCGMECCHNDSNPSNNRIENLRWDTHLENNRDRVRRGSYLIGENHKMAKFKESDVIAVLSGEKDRRDIGMTYRHLWRIRRGDVWKHLQRHTK